MVPSALKIRTRGFGVVSITMVVRSFLKSMEYLCSSGARMEQFTSTPLSMKSRRQPPAPWKTPAMLGPELLAFEMDSLVSAGNMDETEEIISVNAPTIALRVQD